MNIQNTPDFDFDEISRSSGNMLRAAFDKRVIDWMDRGLITCNRWQFSMRGRIALFIRTRQWINQYMKRLDHDEKERMHFLHMLGVNGSLKRFIGKYAHGGSDHQELSQFAALFLIDRGKSLFFEKMVNGRRVDIASTDFEWLIECGDTNVDIVLEHLLRVGYTGIGCTYYCVLPFQSLRFDTTPFMYVFQRGANWSDKVAENIAYGID